MGTVGTVGEFSPVLPTPTLPHLSPSLPHLSPISPPSLPISPPSLPISPHAPHLSQCEHAPCPIPNSALPNF
ncbi:MAG: hypothetical protein F6J93_05035 [Oscillatoria sp. SIO1A7]|nr:hypothetical protein [Oscillatoria sp. SIO1A7]